MDQRGAVDQLHDSRQMYGAGTPVPGISRRQQQQSRTQALAAAAQQVAGNFRDRLAGLARLVGNFLLDEGEVVADQIENLFNRQYGDSAPPKTVPLAAR